MINLLIIFIKLKCLCVRSQNYDTRITGLFRREVMLPSLSSMPSRLTPRQETAPSIGAIGKRPLNGTDHAEGRIEWSNVSRTSLVPIESRVGALV